MSDDNSQQIFEALIKYIQSQITKRMIAYGENFDMALAAYFNEVMEPPK